MNVVLTGIELRGIQFLGNSVMLVSLSNERTFMVPLDKFKKIEALSEADRKDYEIIDGENLSFLALDDIYTIHELLGLPPETTY